MTRYKEDDVRRQMTPYHGRIVDVVRRGHGEWVAVKKFMAKSGFGSVLYPRTVANHVFDAVVRSALAEFADDPDIRIIDETQTIKFCFGNVVLARFKKGDEDNLGRNQPTQAVLDFVSAQGNLPGFAPSAAKVEILYSVDTIEDGIERIVIAARDGANLLWHYELDDDTEANAVIPFPEPAPLQSDDADDEQIVTPRKRGEDAADDKGD
ncbi:MAG TPA: hypothetical protein VLA52_15285 [Thermohalobaculum sp.]|nr:hypothetical protein [Thermohalobaculum sp.]